MQQHNLDHILAGIEGLDLAPIMFKLTCEKDEYRWSREHAERIAVAYKRFLVLMAKYPERTIAPTRDIDTFWHAHILDTRKYAADCERIFGEFVHHYPYLGLNDDDAQAQEDAGDAMSELYMAEFGEELPFDATAYCAREPQAEKSTAYCAREPQAQTSTAYCAREPQAEKSTAYCAREPQAEKSTAYCAREPQAQKSTAYCAREPQAEKSTAYCAREPQAQKSTAYCAREPQAEKSTAYCAREPQAEKSTAYCARAPLAA